MPVAPGSITLALDVIRQGAIDTWKEREEEKKMDCQVVAVAALQHERRRFCQTTQRLLQILSEQQFLKAGTFEEVA